MLVLLMMMRRIVALFASMHPAPLTVTRRQPGRPWLLTIALDRILGSAATHVLFDPFRQNHTFVVVVNTIIRVTLTPATTTTTRGCGRKESHGSSPFAMRPSS